jgi:hypothetical protein
MPQDQQQALRRISDHMILQGMGDYLVSEKFSRFCREHEVYEIWGGFLGASGDRPELYGSDKIKNAFFLLLQHICQIRKAEFPKIIAGILADSTKKTADPSFVPTIKQDLIHLGYSIEDVEDSFRTMSM